MSVAPSSPDGGAVLADAVEKALVMLARADERLDGELHLRGALAAFRASSPDGAPPNTCSACGMDLTPTPEQIRAVLRFGNPLRRQPCLETESGMHQAGSLGAPGKDTTGAACGVALVDPTQTGADGLSICDDCREAPDGVS